MKWLTCGDVVLDHVHLRGAKMVEDLAVLGMAGRSTLNGIERTLPSSRNPSDENTSVFLNVASTARGWRPCTCRASPPLTSASTSAGKIGCGHGASRGSRLPTSPFESPVAGLHASDRKPWVGIHRQSVGAGQV
jgi:hypothetical protein